MTTVTCEFLHFQSAEEWRIVFFIASVIYFFGAIIYFLFCSGERQPWVRDAEPPAFDTDNASVTTAPDIARGYDNRAMDHSEI